MILPVQPSTFRMSVPNGADRLSTPEWKNKSSVKKLVFDHVTTTRPELV
jgi:hypothetical protein